MHPREAGHPHEDPGAPQLVIAVARGAERLGYVVIDSAIGGRSHGGLRMSPDLDEAEIRGLARTMTLKYGFLGIPQGGAKAGIFGDPEAPAAELRGRLTAFAQAIAPLLIHRVYVPGPDMGTENEDIRELLLAAGARVRRRELCGANSGAYTAVTVFAGVQQAARVLGRPLAGSRAAIEGFGKVGGPLAQRLADAGVRVVAASTRRGALFNPQGLDVARLRQLAAAAGSAAVERYPDAERISCEALLRLPVDFLCPCARYHAITEDNAALIRARAICPGANNPVTPQAERTLCANGVLCLPDFVTSSGGVLGNAMEFASVRTERIAAFLLTEVGARTAWLLEAAQRQRVPPRQVAEALARQRFEAMRRQATRRPLQDRCLALGVAAYRCGWVPGPLAGIMAPTYFKRRLRVPTSGRST